MVQSALNTGFIVDMCKTAVFPLFIPAQEDN